MSVSGYVMQSQPFSVNDGDGIRTTIFLAGCPLKCRWCSNPEGFSPRPLIGWFERQCIGCGRCEEICPAGIGINLNETPSLRAKCTCCGACVDACHSNARRFMVSRRDADEVISEIEKYSMFYRQSGGGITFSGGEGTSQFEMLDYLSSAFYDMGYDLAIETCGQFEFDKLKPVLERMNLIFMDIKHMDDERHIEFTGASNRLTLSNAARLKDLPATVVIRIPVIGGFNDDADNIRSTARFVHDNIPSAAIELLPYHRLGNIKYEAIGLDTPDDSFYTPDAEVIEEFLDIIREEGVETASYR